ncbi:LysR family transcriptional regulator [Sphingobium olei]|uniref:LysR family transcriptional regulator n=1 Tax=Sphingobium olei TaxID=420955 RepID=A0ABW3P4Q3_9SPHN
MTQQPASPADPAATIAGPIPPDRRHWTPARQRLFLIALLESGNVARAAKAAGMSRSSAHRLRARLAGTPFDLTWTRALALHAERMADPFAPQPAPPRQPRAAP